MPEYELRLRFTAADDQQAARLALAWADTCAAEYSTRLAGFERLTRDVTAEVLAGMREIPTACGWCGRAIARSAHRGTWLAVKGEERCYDPQHCDQNYNDAQHEPPSARGT